MKKYDIRERKDLLKEKRVYVSMTGEEIDVTFVPMIVTELFNKWQEKQQEINKRLPEWREQISKEKDESKIEKMTEDFNKLIDETQQTGFDIILTTLAVNGRPETTIEDLKKIFCDQTEFVYLIRSIVGINDLDDNSKKK